MGNSIDVDYNQPLLETQSSDQLRTGYFNGEAVGTRPYMPISCNNGPPPSDAKIKSNLVMRQGGLSKSRIVRPGTGGIPTHNRSNSHRGATAGSPSSVEPSPGAGLLGKPALAPKHNRSKSPPALHRDTQDGYNRYRFSATTLLSAVNGSCQEKSGTGPFFGATVLIFSKTDWPKTWICPLAPTSVTMTIPRDERPGWVIGMEWATQVLTIAIEMALPGLAGFWLDSRLGTKALFLIAGVVLGFVLGLWQLLRLVNRDSTGRQTTSRPRASRQPSHENDSCKTATPRGRRANRLACADCAGGVGRHRPGGGSLGRATWVVGSRRGRRPMPRRRGGGPACEP